jgi:hypothetical protein
VKNEKSSRLDVACDAREPWSMRLSRMRVT